MPNFVQRWLNSLGPITLIRALIARSPQEQYRDQYRDQYLRGPRWLVVRTARMWIDGGRCVECGEPALDVHHRDYRNRGKSPVDFNPVTMLAEIADCESICRKDHKKKHAEKDDEE